jgi:hypothetical protein
VAGRSAFDWGEGDATALFEESGTVRFSLPASPGEGTSQGFWPSNFGMQKGTDGVRNSSMLYGSQSLTARHFSSFRHGLGQGGLSLTLEIPNLGRANP